MTRSVAAAVVLLAVAAAPAAAKEAPKPMFVCGADRCRELSADGLRAASTIMQTPARAPRRAAPFYDVVTVDTDAAGRRTVGWTSRHVPALGLVRSHGPGGRAMWSRTDWMLTGHLRTAAHGLAARPRSRLDDAAGAVGGGAEALRGALADQAGASRPAPGAEPAGGRGLLGPALAALLLAATALVALRARRSGASRGALGTR